MALRFLNKTPFHLVLIALFGLIAYSNTFDVPFQWDDKYTFIEGNPLIKDLNYFLEPSKAEGLELYDTLKTRYIGYLTFALNYKIHGLDVRGYHVVNIAIHIINSLLVYFLVLLTFRTPFLNNPSFLNNPPSPPFAKGGLSEGNLIALFSALLFVSHPVQTEAVTYIFQRLASLCAFFYLLSLVLYIKSRLTEKKTKYAFYALSLLSAVLAMKTKENAFTLPLVIALYEFFFFKGLINRRILRLVPLLSTMLIIPLSIVGINKPAGEIIRGIGAASIGHQDISRWDYLFTQFRVAVTYIRLLFLPISQNVGYDYPLFCTFFNQYVFLSFVFVVSVLAFAVYLLRLSRYKSPELRITAFGVFWFFITLSVESSIIPIPMLLNEYRLYLPSAWAFAAAAAGVSVFMRHLKNKKIRKAFIIAIAVLPLVLASAAFARNRVWRSEITLWEDITKKSPSVALGHNNLGRAYYFKGLTEKAIEHYLIAAGLRHDYAEPHYNLGVAFESKGLIDNAIERYHIAIKLKPDFAAAHNSLGNAYLSKGSFNNAVEHYWIAARLRPKYVDAYYNLGVAYGSKGLLDKAVEYYRAALAIDPGYSDAHNNLGVIYMEKGIMDEARKEFEIVLQINPNHYQAKLYLDYINKLK